MKENALRWLALALLAPAVLLVLWKWVVRDVHRLEFDAVQARGGTLVVQRVERRRLYFGSGHFGFGGGAHTVELRFLLGEHPVRWKGLEDQRPWVLQVADGAAYLVVQVAPLYAGRRSELEFWKLDQRDWTRIPPEDFPPDLAVCNISPYGPGWTEVNESLQDRTVRVVNHEGRYIQELLDQRFRAPTPQHRDQRRSPAQD